MADETNRRDKPDAPDEQRKPASFGKWMLRAAIGLVLGLGIGAAAGVFVVDTLEPGNPGQPDSLQVLLDSVARSQPPAAPTKRDTAPPVPEPEPEEPATVVPVPDLRDLDEGAAREILADLGFDVGNVLFRLSPRPIGTVLSTFPVAGEFVELPATVNLILSDGRGRRDTLFFQPDSLLLQQDTLLLQQDTLLLQQDTLLLQQDTLLLQPDTLP